MKGGSPRILIVKLSAVGDVVHALPVLDTLRRAMPEAHIGWAVHPGPSNLLENHPALDELVIVPRKFLGLRGLARFSKLLRTLRGPAPGWDIALDLQGLTKSGVAARLSGARRRIGFGNAASRELNRYFMTEKVSPGATSVIQMNLGLLAPLAIHTTEARAVVPCTRRDKMVIQDWAIQMKCEEEKFLVIDPFAGWESKLWPVERWMEVGRKISLFYKIRPLIFHGPGEQEQAEKMAWQMRVAGTHALVAPRTSLREYVALLRMHAWAMVGGDTGPMHIAAAVGVPTVALYGPSDSRRNAPEFHNAQFRVLQDFEQPCAGTFARKCEHHQPGQCMNGISDRQVVDALMSLMGPAVNSQEG